MENLFAFGKLRVSISDAKCNYSIFFFFNMEASTYVEKFIYYQTIFQKVRAHPFLHVNTYATGHRYDHGRLQ